MQLLSRVYLVDERDNVARTASQLLDVLLVRYGLPVSLFRTSSGLQMRPPSHERWTQ